MTSIAAYSFKGLTKVTSIALPDGLLTIADHAFDGCDIGTLVIPDSVTSVGASAFSNNTHLKNLTIGKGLGSYESIGDLAFENDNAVEAIFFGIDPIGSTGTNTTTHLVEYYWWGKRYGMSSDSLKAVFFADTIQVIGQEAFVDCQNLSTVLFVDWKTRWVTTAHIESIGEHAFENDRNVTDFDFGDNLGLISANAFAETRISEVTFPSTLTTILEKAIYGCPIVSLTFPEGMAYIGAEAFEFDLSLQSLNLPSKVSVGLNAFGACNNLNSVAFHGVLFVYSGSTAYSRFAGAFHGDTRVTQMSFDCDYLGSTTETAWVGQEMGFSQALNFSVSLSENVQVIGGYAFNGCTGLSGVSFYSTTGEANPSPALTQIDTNAFASTALVTFPFEQTTHLAGLMDGTFQNCTHFGDSTTAIALPETTTYIGNSAFLNDTALGSKASFTLSSGMFSIHESCFEGCTALGTVPFSLPVNIADIPKNAFKGCTALTSVDFFESLTKLTQIGESAFDGAGFTEVHLPANVTEIGESAFANNADLATLSILGSSVTIGANAFNSPYVNYLTLGFAPSGTTDTSVTPNTHTWWGEQYGLPGGQLSSVTLTEGVTSIGDYAFYDTATKELTLPSTLTSIGAHAFELTALSDVSFDDPLTTIGESAFNNCSMTELTLGSNITSIGKDAFYGNPMATLTLGFNPVGVSDDSVSPATHAWWGSAIGPDGINLTSLTLTETVTAIGDYAFIGTSLTDVTVPSKDSFTIGAGAFDGCDLYELSFPSTVTAIGDGAFANLANLTTLTLLSMPTTRGTGIFANDPIADLTLGMATISGSDATHWWGDALAIDKASLVSLTLQNTVTSISANAFANCTALESADLGSGIIEIPSSCFYNDGKLSSIALTESLTTIDDHAFYGAAFVDDPMLPESVTTIKDYAFYGCVGMTQFAIGKNVASIGRNPWANCPVLTLLVEAENTAFVFDNGILNSMDASRIIYYSMSRTETALDLGEWASLRTIDSYAFAWSELVTVTLPDTLTTLMDYSFFWCTSLTTINLPTALTTLQRCAFYGDTALTSAIVIPTGITILYDSIFLGCSHIPSVTFSEGLTTISNSAFESCSSLTTLNFPTTLTGIGAFAFYKDSGRPVL
ncbi:MAG: leucine-rich repeat domain-containing protein [Bacilli bacterium]|nr:leucine-rich repeat domain-containing protein [Bacilli bacterium]